MSGADLALLLKALLGAALGFAVGWERERHGHEAGVRTLALICMGSAVFSGLAEIAFPVADRVVANIITGVGFLGAGMILQPHAAGRLRGLTTAASIWTMTSVGVVVGTGHYLLGVLLTLLVLLLLWWQYVPWLAPLLPHPAPPFAAAEPPASPE